MKKVIKVFRKILVGLTIFIVVVVGVLIANNRIWGANYRKLVTDSSTLTKNEINMIARVFSALKEKGDNIFNGLGNESNNANTTIISCI